MEHVIVCKKCGRTLARIEDGCIKIPCGSCSRNAGEEIDRELEPEQIRDEKDHKI